MKVLSFIILVFSTSWANAKSCNIELFPRYVVIGEMSANDLTRIVKKHNCNSKMVNTFIGKLLQYRQQNVNTKFLAQSLGLKQVQVTPESINIQSAAQLLKDRTDKNSKLDFYTNIRSLTREKVISINPGASISVDCTSCGKYGEVNALLKINSPYQVKGTQIWIKAKKMTTIEAYVATNEIAVDGKGLSITQFTKKIIKTASPHLYSIDTSSLKFSKLNKPLNMGKPLSKSDTLPLTLVHTGRPVQMKLKTKFIELTGSAIPRTSGNYGDSIQLTQPGSGRIVIGKVVDKNKVVVEL